MTAKTLYDKIWDDHVVAQNEDGTAILYIDRHLVHEVTSPQAFEGLRIAGRKVRAPERTLAVVDHNVPTSDRTHGIDDPESKIQVERVKHFFTHYKDLEPGKWAKISHVGGYEDAKKVILDSIAMAQKAN